MGFVDLHSHVLPGLDDGCSGLEESLELLAMLAKMGFDTVCATPHQKAGFFAPTADAVAAAHSSVNRALAERGLGLAVGLGAENFWDELFLERARTDAQPMYSGDRAFLFEIQAHLLPPRLEDMLFQMRLRGRLPVMAHPERCVPLWDSRDRLEAIARTAALVVDLGALDGAHGRLECKAARRLVEEGVAHAVASDVHTSSDARSAAAGIAWIRKHLGDSAVERLLDHNPRRILQGELPD